jgi:transketolase
MMRAIHTSTVLYPSDATCAAALTNLMASNPGISFLRTTRGAYPVLYDSGESFQIGGSKVPRRSDQDQVTLVGAGVTLHNCLAAAEELAGEGIRARVIDLYSVKPVDSATLRQAVADTAGRMVIAEDHSPEGGLAAAVLEALAVSPTGLRLRHLAVREMPGSGTPEELMEAAGISSTHIAKAARELLEG